jgi:hypothetical protein
MVPAMRMKCLRPLVAAPAVALAAAALALAFASAACSKSEPVAPAPGTASVTGPGGDPPSPSATGVQIPQRMVPKQPTDATPVDISNGSCEVTVEGDVQTKVVAPADAHAVGTDYWMTPEQIDEAVAMMVNMMVKDKTKAAAEIAKAKTNEPRIMLLIVNCNAGAVHLTFSPGIGSKYKDVPFAAGKYAITRTPKNNEFGVMFSVDNKFYRAAEGGSIDITRFDKTGITASFEFPAENTDRVTKAVAKVTVKGRFDYPCPPTNLACKH